MPNRRKQGKSRNWANRQSKDIYVRKARETGMRARSAFKLEQIDSQYRLIRPGMHIVDLGAAPGSWSQYALNRIRGNGIVVGIDLLEIHTLPGYQFFQGDFTDLKMQEKLRDCLDGGKFDLVLSDMAPNITGIRTTDQARAAELQQAVLEFCHEALVKGGSVVTKLFEGEDTKIIRTGYQSEFESVQMIKPDASRQESKEVYLLARKFRTGI